MNRVSLFLLVCWSTLAAWAQSSASSERVLLSRDPQGELTVQVNASAPVFAADLRAGADRDGVRFRMQAGVLSLGATRRPVSFEWDDLKGELPPQNTVRLEFASGTIDVATPGENIEAVRLLFPDSATAELPPDTTARAEFLDDRSYSLTGSTNLAATSADGQLFRFSRQSGPMLGGKLVEQMDARGNRRFSRSSPAAAIHLSGALNGEVKVAGQSAVLVPGQERLLTFTNGARVFLKHDAARNLLDWKVARGAGHFTVAGFSCWKATAISGQSGTLQWNPERRVVDLKHAAESSGTVIAQLSGRVCASAAPGATFQYAQFQDCGSFATSGLGDVLLHDRETGESLPLEMGAIAYNEGARVGGGTPGRPFVPITLTWDTEARIQIRGAGTTYPVTAGTELTTDFAGEKMGVAYRTDGSVLIRALAGNFNLRGTFIPELSFDIPEGGALLLRLNRQRLVFTAQAAPGSAADVRVISGGQTYMFLSGDARVTVVLGQNSILPEGNTPWIFFEGAGGDQTFLSGPQPGQVLNPTRIDVDRINQPPVSILE